MFTLIAGICSIFAAIFAYIVGFNVVMAAAPQYIGYWWVSVCLVVATFIFNLFGKLNGED